MANLIMGSEGPMGQLVFVGVVNEKTVTIRTSPINAALAVKGYVEEHVRPGVSRWVIQIWDITAMGEARHEPVAATHGTNTPTLETCRMLDDQAKKYLANPGGGCNQ